MCEDRQSVNPFCELARFSECRRVFSQYLNLHLRFQTTNKPVAHLIIGDATDLLSNPLHGVNVLRYGTFLCTAGQLVPCTAVVICRFKVCLHVCLERGPGEGVVVVTLVSQPYGCAVNQPHAR